jgi:hypothetical protein
VRRTGPIPVPTAEIGDLVPGPRPNSSESWSLRSDPSEGTQYSALERHSAHQTLPISGLRLAVPHDATCGRGGEPGRDRPSDSQTAHRWPMGQVVGPIRRTHHACCGALCEKEGGAQWLMRSKPAKKLRSRESTPLCTTENTQRPTRSHVWRAESFRLATNVAGGFAFFSCGTQNTSAATSISLTKRALVVSRAPSIGASARRRRPAASGGAYGKGTVCR